MWLGYVKSKKKFFKEGNIPACFYFVPYNIFTKSTDIIGCLLYAWPFARC